MKCLLFILLSFYFYRSLYAQNTTIRHFDKPVLDTSSLGKWPYVDGAQISGDGNYCTYTKYYPAISAQTIVIQATKTPWKMEIPGGQSATITQDSRQVVCLIPNDSLMIVDLETHHIEYIEGVENYTLPKESQKGWMAYSLKTSNKELVLRNLITRKEITFENVNDCLFSNAGNKLLLKTELPGDSSNENGIELVNLPSGKRNRIWRGNNPSNYNFDNDGQQLAFLSDYKVNDEITPVLWYYKMGMEKPAILINNQAEELKGQWILNTATPQFNQTGDYLFFNIKKIFKDTIGLNYKLNRFSVDVWNYKDSIIQSHQLEDLIFANGLNNHRADINIATRKIIILERQGEKDITTSNMSFHHEIIMNNTDGVDDFLNASIPSFWLVDIRTGERILIRMNLKWSNNSSILLSPGEKYVIYYDGVRKNFFAYNVYNHSTKNITAKISVPLYDTEYDHPDGHPPFYSLGTWLPHDSAVLLYDKYDIWLVDPEGIKSPINITRGFGKKHKLVFRLLKESTNPGSSLMKLNGRVILSAFSPFTKYNGFYSLDLQKEADPELLTMGPYIYILPNSLGFSPLMARNENVYIVKRMSVSEAPNYFATGDFKSYRQLSDNQPQRGYNWMTSELVKWNLPSGKTVQGILFKPENFNPRLKYPLIFEIYERLSDHLNEYVFPIVSNARINIPYFVSNGYLVFEPDIYYKAGQVTQCVTNTVVSAIKKLVSLPYIDNKKIGLQGHSFGGYEVNCLITHTNVFAAAAEGSGLSDLISDYGDIGFHGISLQSINETGQNRIGATLWQDRRTFIENSPIFFVDKITTPLLMMNNKNDYAVPFNQGLEFFNALRRLNKTAWLLQYDGAMHVLGKESGMDYTLRLKQFFDHYLKDAAMPDWMNKGVPAKLKGYYSGF